MHGPNATAMCWKACGNRSRQVFYEYNLAGVLDLNTFAE
jgi:hypothetical protein